MWVDIMKTELGGLGYYGNTCEVRLQDDFRVSSASLVLARIADTHNS